MRRTYRRRRYRKYHYSGRHNRLFWLFRGLDILLGGPGRRGR